MNSNNRHYNCERSAEIVSYLYDETTSFEKRSFETHLADCSNCADEFAVFFDLHFAVGQWRDDSFAKLPTPEIAIPYHESAIRRKFAAETHVSQLEKLRRLFNFSSWKLAMSAAAILAVCTIAVIFAAKFSQHDETARIVQPEIKPAIIASATQSPAFDQTQPAPISSDSGKTFSVAPESKSAVNPVLANAKKSGNKYQLQNVRAVNIQVKNAAGRKIIQPSNEMVADNENKFKKTPHLNGDDEETNDESLRLSDLFDETDK